VVTLGAGDPPAASLSLAAGLALIEAVELAAPALPLMLKWPNDLMLGRAKLAGILLERTGDRIVAGFGVNLASAPALPEREAASLGAKISPQAFAPLLAGSFARLLSAWRSSDPEAFARAWLARAHPVGTHLTVHAGPEEKVTGMFAGIEVDGALRLRLESGEEQVIRAGDAALG
jgi:BirA family biotin operon repressor/biotin-[acetyl-CoA-carboxylase] ligase